MSSHINPETRLIVANRANYVCEYCLIAEEDAFFKHQVEHIISRKHGGSSELGNFALACVFCNRHKGSDIGSLIPETNTLIRFFNPRTDRWHEHFRLHDIIIGPISEIGEATVRILQMNHEDQISERQVLARRGRYPSQSAWFLIREN